MSRKEQHFWKDNAQAEFNRWAHTYDQSVLNHLLFHRCYLKFIEFLVRYYPSPDEPLRLLDVGCGTGTFVSMLKSVGLPVRPLGLDMAEAMCRLAQQKAHEVNRDPAVGFINGDSEHMPFADGTFDVVTCSNSYHHYPHQTKVLAEFWRILRPGGRVIIIDGYRDNILGWLIFDVGVALAEKAVHHVSAGEVRAQLRGERFTDIVQEKFGLWVPVLATVAEKSQVKKE